MSKRTVIDCDRCGMGPIANPVQVRVFTGWYSDPCEGQKRNHEDIDLCSACAAWAFSQIAKDLDEGPGNALVAAVRERRKKGVPLT